MAKEPDPLMPLPKMKMLLMASKKEPVNAAIALDKDKNPFVLLDKKAKPRKVAALMRSKAKEAKIELNMATIRFGTAEVNPEIDSKLVKFTVNKQPPGGMELKVKSLLREVGFGKCDIAIDEKLDAEPEEDESDEAAPVAAAPGKPAEQGNADMGALSKQLTDLVKRMMGMMGSNPAAADAMKTAAMEGQAAVKANDATGVQSAIDTLKRMMDAAAGGAAAPAAAGGARPQGAARNAPGSPVFKTAQVIWDTARKMVEGEIGKLAKELKETYKDHPIGGDITSVFEKKVEPVLANLDKKLSDKLAEVQKEKEAVAHGKLVTEAKAIITQYQQYLASEKLIQQLDTNPFVDLKIEETLTKSLTQLAKAVV